MVYKSGSKSLSEVIGELKRIPNQNLQVNSIVPFENAVWVDTADSKIIVIEEDRIKVYDSDPELWDDFEIEGFDELCKDAEKL